MEQEEKEEPGWTETEKLLLSHWFVIFVVFRSLESFQSQQFCESSSFVRKRMMAYLDNPDVRVLPIYLLRLKN